MLLFPFVRARFPVTFLGLVLNRQEELELRWKLLLRVQPIREVDPSNSAIGVNLHSQSLNVVGTVRPSREIGQVELNLVPALVETHGHRTNERLHSRRGLVVGCSKPTADILIVKHLNLKAEVLLQVLDDHDQEWQLNSKRPVRRQEKRQEHVSRGGQLSEFDATIRSLGASRRRPRVGEKRCGTYMAGSAGQVMYIVLTFVPMISRTED